MNVTKNRYGYDTVAIPGAVASSLGHYLDPAVPWVWLLGHMPNRAVRWWTATTPVNVDASIRGRIRSLRYDLQLPTPEFLNRVTEFDDHGLALVLADREMPDTLELSRIPERRQDSVLMENGAVMRIYLPHAGETAVIVCYREGLLADRAP